MLKFIGNFKELENYGFKYYEKQEKTHKYAWENGAKDYYIEKGYILDDGTNIIEIVKERINSDWIHENNPRDIRVRESCWDAGVSMNPYDVIYDLIKIGPVVKEEENAKL